ncbi:hypothetical protein [Lysobacter brunescens]|uniref:Secreted protein n=1 Tax=Lysobacter brunescens TaxID=262323 RepID=A0ABW2YIM5_9GAMM
MTTKATGPGRPLAIHRALRGTSRILLAGLLACASLQAFAADPVTARDPLDRSQPLMAPVNDATLGNPLSLPERTLIFARDIHTIFNASQVPGKVVETAEAPKEGRIRGMLKRGLALLGNGQFLHSPRTGKDVEVASLTTGYWSQRYLKGRRVVTQ